MDDAGTKSIIVLQYTEYHLWAQFTIRMKNESKKMPLCNHFEFPISSDLPYGMSLYSAILSPNMKTIGPNLLSPW
jgi:hypothetical protein